LRDPGPTSHDGRDVGRRDGRKLDGSFVCKCDRCGRFINQIDCFIGQEPIGDIACRELRSRLDRIVGNGDAMVLRVPLAQASKNVRRLLDARLLDHDRLESPLECWVRLDVLAVFVERRGADALQVAARQFRFDHRTQIEGSAFGSTGADQRVQFVDKEHDVASATLYFLENAV